jgi:hypothetical protein
MIFVLTADFDLAFHKDDPYFPLFKETLIEKNILIRIMWYVKKIVTNVIPFVDAVYNFRCISIFHESFYPVGCYAT